MATARLPLPPLLPGQVLTGEEFLARWYAMPELKCAELLDGIVYMPSPVSRFHGRADGRMMRWLARYADATPGTDIVPNTTWLMENRSIPQPDVALYIVPEAGGQCRYSGSLLAGAPELIVEISYSSADNDFNIKRALYERAGVREYLTVDLLANKLSWRQLVDGAYQVIVPGDGGLLRSACFPGLWLDEAAFWQEDTARMTAAVASGLASAEHAAFADRLNRTARESKDL